MQHFCNISKDNDINKTIFYLCCTSQDWNILQGVLTGNKTALIQGLITNKAVQQAGNTILTYLIKHMPIYAVRRHKARLAFIWGHVCLLPMNVSWIMMELLTVLIYTWEKYMTYSAFARLQDFPLKAHDPTCTNGDFQQLWLKGWLPRLRKI